MDKKEFQKSFDDVKWYDSVRLGNDQCGAYDFCCRCRKTDKFPCARAAYRYRNGYIRIAVVRTR